MKNLLFLILFICSTWNIFAQQRVAPFSLGGKYIHKLDSCTTLLDSMNMEVENVAHNQSQQIQLQQLKNYIGSNLPDTAFKRNIDSLILGYQYAEPSDLTVLTVNNLGVTKKTPMIAQKNLGLLYWSVLVDSLNYNYKSDSLTVVDSDGDTITFENTYLGGCKYQGSFYKKNGGPPNFQGTICKITPVCYSLYPDVVTGFGDIPYFLGGYASVGEGCSWTFQYTLCQERAYGSPTIEETKMAFTINLIY